MKPHIGSEVNIEFISPVRSEMISLLTGDMNLIN